MQWFYRVVQSQGGQVQTPNGAISVVQMLNMVGQNGGELVTVVPVGTGFLSGLLILRTNRLTKLFSKRKTSRESVIRFS